MPKKPNSHGNDQEYVPAGNGDASGEYADEGGSNKGFSNFKKPERDTQQLPKSTERRVYERDMKEETDPNIKTYMGEDGSKKIIKKIGENKYRIEHWERYENNGDPFWEKPFDDPDVYSKGAIQRYYGREYVPGEEEKKIQGSPREISAINRVVKRLSKSGMADWTGKETRTPSGKYALTDGYMVVRRNDTFGVTSDFSDEDDLRFGKRMETMFDTYSWGQQEKNIPTRDDATLAINDKKFADKHPGSLTDMLNKGSVAKITIGDYDVSAQEYKDALDLVGDVTELITQSHKSDRTGNEPIYIKGTKGDAIILPMKKR